MDWSKAKTILIIALLVTNLVMGGTYLGERNKERAAQQSAAQNAVVYAQLHGVDVRCPLPYDEKKLPVLFVSIDRNGTSGECEYKGIPVEAGEGFAGSIVPEGQGDAKGRLISAANALVKLINELGDAEGLEITDVSVVYWLDRSLGDDVAAKDTAIPAWKFEGPDGVYYIQAFEE